MLPRSHSRMVKMSWLLSHCYFYCFADMNIWPWVKTGTNWHHLLEANKSDGLLHQLLTWSWRCPGPRDTGTLLRLCSYDLFHSHLICKWLLLACSGFSNSSCTVTCQATAKCLRKRYFTQLSSPSRDASAVRRVCSSPTDAWACLRAHSGSARIPLREGDFISITVAAVL